MDKYATAKGVDSSRSMKVVFVLDTTVSMKRKFADSNTRILDEMNDLVEKLLKDIMESSTLSPITKVAFITFSDGVTMETPFVEIKNLDLGCFQAPPDARAEQKVTMKPNVYVTLPGGIPTVICAPRFEAVAKSTPSRIGSGVIRALNKLDEERALFKAEMDKQGRTDTRPYVPVMVVISDGAPEVLIDGVWHPTSDWEEEEKAKKMVKRRCYSEGDASKLAFPVICAIGDEAVREQMKEYMEYSADYQDGFQYIDLNHRGKGFEELIVKIGQSLTQSISLSGLKEKEKQQNAMKSYNGKQETFRAASIDQESDDAMLLRRSARH